MKAAHPQARDHSWAQVDGAPTGWQQRGVSQDGEPAVTAAEAVRHSLIESGVGELRAGVVRCCGGVRRGAGGLVRGHG
ncbi:YigZ family protein, partial [Plesiomonas shigelloides]|nr:YigZ family protein [Plesiomonas shigelloides]